MKKEVYHVTDARNIRSFIEQGGLPNFSDGRGQGKGLYVWINRFDALEHLGFVRKNKAGFNGAILTLDTEKYNPGEWLPDLEINADIVINLFFKESWKIKGGLPIDTKRGLVTSVYPEDKPYERLVVKLSTGEEEIDKYECNFPIRQVAYQHVYGVAEAQILGPMLDKLREKEPEFLRRQCIEWHQNGRMSALRYVGQAPLKVKELEKIPLAV